jgi:hypothetical protein
VAPAFKEQILSHPRQWVATLVRVDRLVPDSLTTCPSVVERPTTALVSLMVPGLVCALGVLVLPAAAGKMLP